MGIACERESGVHPGGKLGTDPSELRGCHRCTVREICWRLCITRVHFAGVVVQMEKEVFYRLCDELGILV